MSAKLTKGDYVLAAKYADGDPYNARPWSNPMSELEALIERLEAWAKQNSGGNSDYGSAALVLEAATTIRTLTAQLEEVRKERAWRPIETAPKDGTKVLVGRFTGKPKAEGEGRQAADLWHDRAKHGYEGWGQFNSHYWPATHWQPLPDAPVTV